MTNGPIKLCLDRRVFSSAVWVRVQSTRGVDDGAALNPDAAAVVKGRTGMRTCDLASRTAGIRAGFKMISCRLLLDTR